MKTSVQPQLPQWISRYLAWTLALVFIALPFHAFLSTWGGTAVGPLWLWKSWKEILLAIGAFLVLGWALSNPRPRQEIFTHTTLQLLVLFALIGAGATWLWGGGVLPEAAIAGVAMGLRYFVGFGLAYVLMRFCTRVQKYDIRKIIVGTGVLVAVLGLVQVTLIPLDFLSQFGYDKSSTIAPYTLIDDNPNAPRAFGTLSGPNDYGAFLMLPIVVTILFIRHRWWLWGVLGIEFLALYASSSRSAWLGMATALVALALLFGATTRHSKKFWAVLGVGVIVGATLLVSAIMIPSIRLQVFHSSPGDSSLIEGSTAKHFEATYKGIERVVAEPFGCGFGCAGPASSYGTPRISENYYVQIAEETGFIGLAVWLIAVGVVVRELWRYRGQWLAKALLASFVGLSVVGLWLHVWADDPVSLWWWMLAGGLIGYNERQKWNKSKNTSRSKTSSSS